MSINMRKQMRRILSAICVFLILFLIVPAGVEVYDGKAAAATGRTIYVDSGKNVLSDAIENAQTGDTIILKSGLYEGPTEGRWVEHYYEPTTPVFSKELEIDKSLEIIGRNGVIIRDNPFKITADNVTISNITFDHSLQRDGGAIEIKGSSNVVIEKCEFSGSETLDYGGAVYVFNSQNVTIKDCNIKDNYGKYGGGVNIEKSSGISVRYCDIEDNLSYRGGGGYVEKSSDISFIDCSFNTNSSFEVGGSLSFVRTKEDCEVINCTFKGNTAERSGGALHSYKADEINVSNCSFQENLSLPEIEDGESNPQGYGGAVFAKASTINMSGCELSKNESYYGGGIYTSEGTVSLDTCGLFNNRVHKHQGTNIGTIVELALTLGTLDFQGFIQSWVEMGVTKGYCPDNVVFPWDGWRVFGGDGGAIYTGDTVVDIKNSELNGNSAEKAGGGLYIINSKNRASASLDSTSKGNTVNIAGTVFYHNSSQQGGGAASLAKDAVFENCTFRENEAEAVGGGLYTIENTKILNSTFHNNKAPVGGGICSSVIGKTTVIRNSNFEENIAYDSKGKGGGGAIYAFGADKDADKNPVAQSDCKLNLSGCTFQQNASYNGGAVYLLNLDGNVSDNTFTENGVLESGGAFYTENVYLDVKKCEFKSNRAQNNGGAVYVDEHSYLFIDRSKILDNTSDIYGGGIYAQHGFFKGTNSLLTGNSANGGNAVYLSHNEAAVINCTISLNGYMPIVAFDYSPLKLHNNIIVANSKPETVAVPDIMNDKHSYVTAENNICALEGNDNITATIDIFRDPGAGDFRIRNDFLWDYLGPMDAGSNDHARGNKDLDGNPRFIDNSGDGQAKVDIGAYEQDMLKVTFAEAHPQARVHHGSIGGDTEQQVLWGEAADESLVTVIMDDGWEFDGWESLEHKKVEDFSSITGNLKLYAAYKQKYVTVAFRFEPDKIKVTDKYLAQYFVPNPLKSLKLIHQLLPFDSNTMQYVVPVKQYESVKIPDMEGFNGWRLGDWDPWPPQSVSEDTLVTAVARPTVTYDFGDKGYYGNDKQKVVSSSLFNPLFVPEKKNIRVDAPYKLLGWSDKKGGKVITLPGEISEPTTYYAVYGDLRPQVVFDNVTKSTPPYLSIDTFKDAAEEGVLYEITGHIADECGEKWTANVDFGSPVGPYRLKINSDKTFSFKYRFYDDQSVQQVEVNVWNNYGYAATATAQVMVKNVTPTVDAGDDALFYRGVLFNRRVFFKDPGRDNWKAVVDYGNGTTRTMDLRGNSFGLSQVYDKSGTYPVSVTVRDQDGGVGKDRFQLKIKDYLLTFYVGEDTTIKEGETLKREIIMIGPVEKIKSAEVDFGDGSAVRQLIPDRKLMLSHSYPDDGNYRVGLRVTDVDDDEYNVGFNVEVQNAVPVVNAGSGGTITANQTFSGSGSFSDPGQDTWTAQVNYGDDSDWHVLSLNGKNFTLSHSYNSPGDYSVKVKVTDDDGGEGEGSCRVSVRSTGRALSSEARLSSMVIAGGFFSAPGPEEFTPNTINYSVRPTNADEFTITAQTMDENATISAVIGDQTYNDGNINIENDYYGEVLTITVTAENGTSTKQYTVNIL